MQVNFGNALNINVFKQMEKYRVEMLHHLILIKERILGTNKVTPIFTDKEKVRPICFAIGVWGTKLN